MPLDPETGKPFPSFLNSREPRGCLVAGCTKPATRTVHLADHLTVATTNKFGRSVELHTVACCVEHDGLLRYLGVTVPVKVGVTASTHWLDDAETVELEHPPWRVVELGLPGMAHPGKAKRIAKEMAS